MYKCLRDEVFISQTRNLRPRGRGLSRVAGLAGGTVGPGPGHRCAVCRDAASAGGPGPPGPSTASARTGVLRHVPSRSLNAPVAMTTPPAGSPPPRAPLPRRGLTCCELRGRGLALVGPADGADPHLVAGAGPQGLDGVLAQRRLQPEGRPPAFPARQAVLQENEVDSGAGRGPLHEGHGVGDIAHQDLRGPVDHCMRRTTQKRQSEK